jgi:hypothetical protein
MTPDQQRIAIAQACGWTNFSSGTHKGATLYGQHPNARSSSWELPNYLGDLNAMHEAEKVLTQEQMIDYSRHVGKAVTSHLPASRAAWMDFKLIHATAAQRAEAFLRTLNLWQPTPTQPQ